MTPARRHLRVLLAALCACTTLFVVPAGAARAELDARAREAQELSWAGQFDAALELYDAVLAVEPDHALARLERAKVLSWAQRYDESAAAFRALLESKPGHVEARIGLARVLSWSGRYVEARREYQVVLSDEPGHPEALLGVAQTWAWSGDLRRARPAYEAAARAAGSPKDAEVGLGYLDLWEGQLAAARRRADNLAMSYPDDEDVRVLRAAVRAATAPWVSASWDQLDDSDRNLLTTTRLEAGGRIGAGPALRLAYADYDVRTAGRVGSIRSLQGFASWNPAPGHELEAMLATDSLESPGFDDYDLRGWGLKWSFPTGAGWSGSATARREPFRYAVPLIDNRIVIESLAVAINGRIGNHWSASAQASGWRLSDDNRRVAAELAARRGWDRGAHRLEAGARLHLLDWRDDLDNGYFDPSAFRALGLTGRAFGPLGSDRADYDLGLEVGLQSFDTNTQRTRNDPYYLVVLRLGRELHPGLRLEGWAEAGSYASQGAEDWRYTRVGARLVQRFGGGR